MAKTQIRNDVLGVLKSKQIGDPLACVHLMARILEATDTDIELALRNAEEIIAGRSRTG